jgi:peptidoglycan/LPS O-acetylase OafA/YrhL
MTSALSQDRTPQTASQPDLSARESPRVSPRPTDIPSLTGVRFVAALSILVGHFAAAYSSPHVSAQALAPVVRFGMPLFFVLSGFIIHTVYAPLFARASVIDSTATFLWARLTRLFPLLWFLLFATLAINYQQIATLLFENPERWKILLYYLSGTFTWFYIIIGDNALIQYPFGWSWSISTELFFYVLYIFISRRIGSIASAAKLRYLIFAYCVLVFALFFSIMGARNAWLPTVYHAVAGPFGVDDPQYATVFFRWLTYESPYARCFEFLLGCLVAQLCRLERRNEPPRRAGFILTALALGSILAIYRVTSIRQCTFVVPDFCETLAQMHRNFVFAPSIALLLYCLYRFRTPLVTLLEWKPIVLLGEASYSIYLIHVFILHIFLRAFLVPRPLFWSSWLDFAYSLVFGVALVLVFAVGSYRVIEVPARAWLRTAASTPRARLAASGIFLAAVVWTAVSYAGGYAGRIAGPARPGPTSPVSGAPAPPAATIADLPAMPGSGGYAVEWDAVDGLGVERVDLPPIVPGQPVLRLTATGDGRLHRLGMQIGPLQHDRVYRVSLWVKPMSTPFLMLDARDRGNANAGAATFDLTTGVVQRQEGGAKAAGLNPEDEGWVRLWLDLRYADEGAVVYLWVLDRQGRAEYPGDGRTAVMLGGVELRPRE